MTPVRSHGTDHAYGSTRRQGRPRRASCLLRAFVLRPLVLLCGYHSLFRFCCTALIYHLKNHYALLFAMREWVEPDGRTVRQVLSTRRGQRPSTWIDWDEIHGTFLKWGGHKIMAVRMAQPPPSQA